MSECTVHATSAAAQQHADTMDWLRGLVAEFAPGGDHDLRRFDAFYETLHKPCADRMAQVKDVITAARAIYAQLDETGRYRFDELMALRRALADLDH